MALGRRARLIVEMANPCTLSIWFDNPGPSAPSFQILLNGAILGEYTAGQYVTVPFLSGRNMLDVIVKDGGIVVGGHFLTTLGAWKSSYMPGSDPFNAPPDDVGGLDSASPTGTPISPGGGPSLGRPGH